MDFHYPGDESIILRDADVIGRGTSYAEGKARWSEATIVLTGSDNYFVSIVGKSEMPGEIDHHSAHFYQEAEDMVRGLVRRGNLPRYLHTALSQAAEDDEDINDALDAYEAAARWVR